MKTYLESYFSAMTHHLNFISENFFSVTLWALVAGLAAWTLEFIEMYVFSDFRYLIFLLLMLAYDAFAGIQKVKYLHNLDPVKYAPASAKVFKDKTFSKLMYYICVLASLHGLAHLQIKGVEVTIFNAFEYAALITIIATEFWSVQENYAEMGKKTLLLLAYDAIKSYVTTKKPADGN
ncbi:phage holin family protein [Dyadobacter diqingensis]|uniref:phage holin family protein n=1 Tax=Dyadobacter diqingensis TaxID=2938121 RepID=UPI0020C26FF7|nr:phage holin family protein [Dyadobacter diqingensis]